MSVVDNIIYKESKIVIPKSLRHDMLNKIHAGHLGIEKCRKRACEVIYWPQINQDIANEMSDCSTCLRYQASNPTEPFKLHSVPDRPYQKVGADLFECAGGDFIVVTYYYSMYPEVSRLCTTTAVVVITSTKAIFARHGGQVKSLQKMGRSSPVKALDTLRRNGTLCTQHRVLITNS